MKVKKTLHQIYSELKELRENRQSSAMVLARAAINGNQERIDAYAEDFVHVDEIICHLSKIEVEYEDKYETGDE